MQHTQPYIDVQNVERIEEIRTPSRIRFKKPKYLIDIDTNILKSIPNILKSIVCGDYFLKN